MQVGVLGASGYAGAELLRLCAGHPELEVVFAGAETQAGRRVSELYPSLAAAYPSLEFARVEAGEIEGLDLLFLALPHGQSQELVPVLVDRVKVLVDLSADFRIDSTSYAQWYGREHGSPQLIDRFVCGLPELYRAELQGAHLVAVPGCYPTAACLALAPLVKNGVIEPAGVVVDAASGVSGAGRKLDHATQFNTVDEDFTAYGLLDHRHTPEMERLTGAQVVFTPHLAPMNRGILATCYGRATGTGADALTVLRDAYRDEPFVVVAEAPPSTKATLGSNCAHLTARNDPRTGWVVSICAIDNLVKGAAGQALQCANIVHGFPETLGLPVAGVYP